MRNICENKYIPDEGYKYITNGKVYTDSIYLGKRDSVDNWHDTNDEPPVADEEEDDLSV